MKTQPKPTQIKRRQFLARLTAGTAAVSSIAQLTASTPARSPQTKHRARAGDLYESVFTPFPIGCIQPKGWLQRQLRIQADGLSGHLDEFWPDVGQSQWFGGKAEGWERAPYWLDGVIPLAWLLGDEMLKAKVQRYVQHIVQAQRPDGWYAVYPEGSRGSTYDLWAILLVNKVLVQYHEATSDSVVLQAVLRNLRVLNESLNQTPLFGWGKFRWFEGLISTYYAYEKTGEKWLIDLAKKLHEQGFDYAGFYTTEDITQPTPRRGLWRWDKHVVNTGMALKAYALAWRFTHRDAHMEFPVKMLQILDRFHGQVTGMFTGDECLAGKNPVQGTELCAVVETMYSLEHLVALTGDPWFADRLERIAFNALPATFAPDMWSHQYDQQVNQVQCTVNPDHMWTTNGPESNIYGLEPNYGCCTANMHQGWPKFAAHLYMKTPGGGVAVICYAPSSCSFEVSGVPVTIMLDTEYPFRETIKLSVSVQRPVRFPIFLRIPGWARGATVAIPGSDSKPVKPGTFHKIERHWKDQEELLLRFPMHVLASRRYNGALAIERGPLVYSLKLGENWTRINADKPHRELPHGDFEVRPTTPWNYGLLVDETKPDVSVKFAERPLGEKPFSPEGAGIVGKVEGRLVRGWKLAHGWAGEIPPEAQQSREQIEQLELIPYGCTNIRVTEFPRLAG